MSAEDEVETSPITYRNKHVNAHSSGHTLHSENMKLSSFLFMTICSQQKKISIGILSK